MLAHRLSVLSLYLCALIIIFSMNPWFVWGQYYNIYAIVAFFILRFVISVEKPQILLSNVRIIPLLLLLLWYVWNGLWKSENVTLLFTQIIPLVFVLGMDLKEKYNLIKYVIVIFSLILAVSTFFYCLFLSGISLPFDLLEHPVNKVYGTFANFYFFIIEAKFNTVDFLRFRSVFTEPGHVGMMCALYLYIIGYDWKSWYAKIMMIALILSFSLAAYILLFAGWSMYLWAMREKVKPAILVVTIVVSSCFVIDRYTSQGGEAGIVSSLILERMTIDENKGISGNNRNDLKFENYYSKFKDTSDYFMGIGKDKYDVLFQSTPNSSYKTFIVQNGLIGTVLFISFFFSVVLCNPNRYTCGLFLLFLLSFIQRPYWNWAAQSYMFIASVSCMYFKISRKYRKSYNLCRV